MKYLLFLALMACGETQKIRVSEAKAATAPLMVSCETLFADAASPDIGKVCDALITKDGSAYKKTSDGWDLKFQLASTGSVLTADEKAGLAMMTSVQDACCYAGETPQNIKEQVMKYLIFHDAKHAQDHLGRCE